MKIHKTVSFSSYHAYFDVFAHISEERCVLTIAADNKYNKYLSMFSASDFGCSRAVHETGEPIRLYYDFDVETNINSVEVFIVNELKMAYEQMKEITNDH